MSQSILTIPTAMTEYEVVVEKSRFIASAQRVANSEDADHFLAAVMKAHPGATHYCYAYVIGNRQKSNDAGEPQGTAGMPILQAIKQSKLNHVMVVVTRYFGGIKLGTGGLARAYNQAAGLVLAVAPHIRYQDCVVMRFTCPYAQSAAIDSFAQAFGKILHKTYQTEVQYEVAIPCEHQANFIKNVNLSLHGELNIESLPNVMLEF